MTRARPDGGKGRLEGFIREDEMRTCSVCGGLPAGYRDGCCGCESGQDASRQCVRDALLAESADAQWMRMLAARLELSGIPWRLELPLGVEGMSLLMEPLSTTAALFVPEDLLETARRVILAELAVN
ncbi:MAG: hypothetical protein KatS3mg024_1412 [Armatimonadota bacterium]|nr:MAG: hypothetical protein KatS3mg024_1412 [Armatimonadota bacterium]